jgi:hypothetical protein
MRKLGLLFGIILAAIVVGITLRGRAVQSGAVAQKPVRIAAPAQGSSSEATEVSRVPYVGCKSDGQQGPVSAPIGVSKVVHIDAKVAQGLAYYESQKDFGVLAPRGWHCFGTYGSNGSSLYVSPEPIDPIKTNGFAGPLIQLSFSDGDTSGRYDVAKVIARVFPAHRKFVTNLVKDDTEEGVESETFAYGAYPTDRLIYNGDAIVEYQTPAQTDGLGTDSRLLKDENPISGVAILTGENPDLLHLSLRLPPSQVDLTASIIHQLESDTARQVATKPTSVAQE